MMKEFYSDLAEKMQAANGVRHKVNGAHSKKCYMPSDYLSERQVSSLHGPVITYHLKKPLRWTAFQAMPQDLQKKYIEGLIEAYGVTNTRLASMFGVKSTVVTDYLTSLRIHRKYTRMTAEQIEAWEKFVVIE